MKEKKIGKKIILFLGGYLGLFFGFILILTIFIGSIRESEEEQVSGVGRAQVSAECERYRPWVVKYCAKYDMSAFVEILMAVMMQESGGRVVDVMQSSECAYNTRYPKTPNGITDTEYSIECGVQALKDAMEKGGCTDPSQEALLKLSLQGYNYGSGYVTWALTNHGGYSQENALFFSKMMANKMGWSGYGDPDYVDHVLRYYVLSYGGNGNQVVDEAMKNLGGKYVWGGASPSTSFDCSGFVTYVYQQCGYPIGRMTAQGFYNASAKIPISDVQLGDMVFFTGTYATTSYITHIGIYVGNGKMAHYGDPGQVSDISVFGTKFVGYGRLQ